MAKRGILEHPKTIELAELLDIPECYAVGVLECLWHHVARYFPHGEVTSLKPSILARSIRYPGDGQALWNALLQTGFLDEQPDGAVLVHDWSEHADNSVHQLLKKREEPFADGHAPFTRARVREMNRAEEDADRSQTVHEPFTNRSRLPEPKPKPEPEPSNAHARDGAVRARAEAPTPQQEAAELLHAGRNILYRFTGAELTGRQREDALCQIAAHLENGRAIDLDLLERAVGLAETGWRENGDGKRRGVGWVLNALRDLLLEVDGGGDAVRVPQEDEDERQARRRELIRAGLDDDDGRFNEVTAAWGARLLDFGYSEPAAEAELRRLLLDVRDNVKAIKGARNGKSTGRAGRPDAANAQPADPRG
jgi:hypothetical protein